MVAKHGSPQKMTNRAYSTYNYLSLKTLLKLLNHCIVEIGEIPIDFIIGKNQIMYLRKLLTSKIQVNDN